MAVDFLTSALYAKMLKEGAARLNEGRKTVNDLNVFPIPDGDTGDNMYMTIAEGFKAADTAASESLGKCSAAAARGMLLGARGNSGVILSRIFAGIAKGLEGLERASVEEYSRAYLNGVEEAYASVSEPVEGTILTVFRESTHYAASRITPASTLETFFVDLISELEASLSRTPDLLDVLKEAGVVDSGGAGLDYITLGMYDAVLGKCSDSADVPVLSGGAKAVNIDLFTEDSVLDFGYCTEFLLRLQTSKVGAVESFDESVIKDYLGSVGESLVFFRDGSVIKVHVHTPAPGDILSACQKWGEFLTVKVENMTLQHEESVFASDAPKKGPSVEFRKKKTNAFVAVASGEGLCEAFRAAGADAVIEGGQTMNPSAASFIEAFDGIEAENIFVFPNNSNIVLTANQAADLYDKANVTVIPTKDVGAGYVAMASIDTSSKNPSDIIDSASQILENVETAMISTAIRDTEMDGVTVRCGEYIGFRKGEVLVCESSRDGAAEKLCDSLDIADHDVVLIFSGKDVPAAEAQGLKEKLGLRYRRTDFMLTDGCQPVYDYIIVLC